MDTKTFLEALSGAAFGKGGFERFCAVLGHNPDDAPGIGHYLGEKFASFQAAVYRLNDIDENTLDRLIESYLASQAVRR